jgi:hypothetical protein
MLPLFDDEDGGKTENVCGCMRYESTRCVVQAILIQASVWAVQCPYPCAILLTGVASRAVHVTCLLS